MMISLTDLLLVLNTAILIGGSIIFFKRNYVIMDTEQFNQVAEALEEYNQMVESSQELEGGEGVQVGFGADYLEDDNEDEDE